MNVKEGYKVSIENHNTSVHTQEIRLQTIIKISDLIKDSIAKEQREEIRESLIKYNDMLTNQQVELIAIIKSLKEKS